MTGSGVTASEGIIHTDYEHSITEIRTILSGDAYMNWFHDSAGHWYCAPYRIYRTTQGHDCWLYSKENHGILARGFPTVDKAKEFCEKHRAKFNES